jgi:hypothetical protein
LLNAGVGLTTEADSYKAGKDIAKDVLSQLSEKPKLAILAVDHLTRKKYDYPLVIKGVREELGTDVPLIGSTCCGVMVNDRLALKSVGLMLLEGDINVDANFCYEKSRKDYAQIAEELVKIKDGLDRNPQQLMLLFQDGYKFPAKTLAQQKKLNSKFVSYMSGFITKQFQKQLDEFREEGIGYPAVQELLEILYDKGWDLPVMGNLASNPQDFVSNEFYNDQVLTDAVLGVVLSGMGDAKFGYGFTQGAAPTGVSCKPTKKIGNFLLKIDDKPALQGFCNALNLEKESLFELENQGFLNYYNILGTNEKVDGKDFYHLTLTLTDPNLENMLMSGFPFDKVPEKIELFRSSNRMILDSAKQILSDVMSNISEPKFLFGIDCILRWSSLGDNITKYIDIIRESVGKDCPTFLVGAGSEIYGTKPKDYYLNGFTFIPLVAGY